MTEAAKKARAAYYRAWRKRNPDKDKKYHETYWEKRAERLTAKNQ